MRALEGLAARVRRAPADPRLAAAREAHAAGDFAGACRLAAGVDPDGAGLDEVRGLAELQYLVGDYRSAEALLRRVVERSGRDVETRVDAEAALALVYLQTNRFAAARGLFAGVEDAIELPIWELMRTWGNEPPYRIDWPDAATLTVPFTQSSDWELPTVTIELDGHLVDARLDTGGEVLTLSREVAGSLGIDPVASAIGTFAGGARAEVGYGRLESVRIGGATVRGVPVAVVDLDRPVVGTGFLRQFLATIDYPEARLVLRPRTGAGHAAFRAQLAGISAVEVPFALALTHLIVARGALDDEEPLTFIVDSGLQDERGAAFAAPARTLAAAGIAIPETSEQAGESGAGHVPLQVGQFPIRRLALGALSQHDLTGLYGVFPDVWQDAAGFPVHGLLSHNFLRRYAWTLDFDAMTMTFVPGAGVRTR